jgi:hypothetical protein
MIPVALYFCIPLLFGAIKKSSPSTSATSEVDNVKIASFVLPAATKNAATPSRMQRSWVEIASCLENDLLAMPAELPINTRNPFAAIGQKDEDESLTVEDDERVVGSEIEVGSEDLVDRTVVTSNPIRDLGLQLNTTMVGQRSRLATINGKTYEQGEMIPVIIEAGEAAAAATTIQLQLAHVDRRFVVLEMDGHQHRLQLRNEVPNDAIVVKSRSE